MKNKVIIIAAIARNGAIGNRNKLIYRLPNDMKRFRLLTTGNTVIMGRHTFESLPKGALPNRRNIVVSRSLKTLPGCDVYADIDEALKSASTENVYIIGGAQLYKEAVKRADRLCLTEVDNEPKDADTFFPPIDDWKEIWREEHVKDERHAYNYAFVDYIRK